METEQALDGYRELADVTGWPEWEVPAPEWSDKETDRVGLQFHKGRWKYFLEYNGGMAPGFCECKYYEALCIWERHVRLWLEERDVAIDYVPAVKKYYLRFDLGRLPIKTIDALQALPDWFDGYHEAQQAATRAMREAA